MPADIDSMVDAIARAVRDGELTIEQIAASKQRLDQLRDWLDAPDPQPAPPGPTRPSPGSDPAAYPTLDTHPGACATPHGRSPTARIRSTQWFPGQGSSGCPAGTCRSHA